jgi:hypothetical protein
VTVLTRLLAWIFRDPKPADDVVARRAAVLASGGEPTHSVVLRLDPAAMADADLAVREEIETAIRTVHPDLPFYDDGYGFARRSEAMLLSYATREPVRLVDAIVDVLANRIPGRPILPAAMIAVAPRDGTVQVGQESARPRVVYPPHEAGRALPE